MREITLEELNENPFALIGKEWMLVTAGSESKSNTMTASWGGMGVLWGKPVAFVFVRPERYTHEFMEREDRFTLSFLGAAQNRDAYKICGTLSGRDGDKVLQAGLTPQLTPCGTPSFREARLVLSCRKLYKTRLASDSFLSSDCLDRWYHEGEGGGLHDMYIAEIEHVYE